MSDYLAPWGRQEGESWDEEVAIQLLQEAGAEVALYEEDGARMPGREHYSARIQEAHAARDMASYREALNGYVEAAREACRLRKHELARRRGT
jgi:hypothetical protein